jgi:hypothetical protein
MRKLAAVFVAAGALMLSGAAAHADAPSPTPVPPFNTPKCLTWDGPRMNYLPCGWTTDGKTWTPPPAPGQP